MITAMPVVERPVPICLGCMWVLVADGPLSCDVYPEAVPEELVNGEGCEKFDAEGEDE